MRPIYLLRSKHGWGSCPRIADHLEDCYVQNLRVVTKIEPNSVCFRWGCTNFVTQGKGSKIFNRAKAISNSSNKAEARKILSLAGINVPETWNTPKKFPCIGRPAHHFGGHHFYVLNSEEDITEEVLANCSYYSAIYPKTKEYRIHGGHGKIIAMQEKPINPMHIKQNRHANHLPFINVKWNDVDLEIGKLGLNAIHALGLDFGAVDIMAFPMNDNLPRQVVCEVNTAPTLRGYLSLRYAKYFDKIRRNPNFPHWSFDQFEKGDSLVWKNFQLEQ